MKRTRNSVYAALPILQPASRNRSSLLYPAFLPSLFSYLAFLPPFDSPACFNHGRGSMPLSSQYRFEGSIFEGAEYGRYSVPLPGPAKVDCGKIPLGKRPAHRRLGCTCSLLVRYNPGPDRGLLNYSVFFDEIVMNAIIIKQWRGFSLIIFLQRKCRRIPFNKPNVLYNKRDFDRKLWARKKNRTNGARVF